MGIWRKKVVKDTVATELRGNLKKKKKRKLKRDSKDQEVHGIQHSYKGILVKIEKHNVIYHINIIKDKNHMSISIDFFFHDKDTHKLEKERSFFHLLKDIYEKPTAYII